MTSPEDVPGGFGSRQEREKRMEQKHVEKIKGYYDRNGEFKRSEKYSGKDQTVYTKDGDKYYWLVMEPKGASGMEVHLTDTHGRITARGAVCQWHTFSADRSGAENIRKCEKRGQLHRHRADLRGRQGDDEVYG